MLVDMWRGAFVIHCLCFVDYRPVYVLFRPVHYTPIPGGAAMNSLLELHEHGQHFWLDTLSRPMIEDGELQQWIENYGLRGITSNPKIFNEAISGSDRYDTELHHCLEQGFDVEQSLKRLMVNDVRDACRLLRGRFDESGGTEGFVSIEVSPHLAYDDFKTIEAARELWHAVDEPNLYIKVPGTAVGLRAIEELLFEGININITLMFGVATYCEVFETFMRAMERRQEAGRALDSVRSVASIFLSRIDVLVDQLLSQRIHRSVSPSLQKQARDLLGLTGIANAKLVYGSFLRFLEEPRWQQLARAGAQPQEIVWASTGVKSPSYTETHYVDPLIGPHTISTMPITTAQAFSRHGQVATTVEEEMADAEAVMDALEALGIDMVAVDRQLVAEGVQKFIDPYDESMATIEWRMDMLRLQRDSAQLEAMADKLRRDVITMTTEAGSGHPTSCLSCAEIMSVLFFREMRWDPSDPQARDVDSFVLSKGHAAPILWAGLHAAGAINEDLNSLRRIDSTLEGHPTPRNPWVKVATGALGQGLSAGNGMALAKRLDGIEGRVFCLLGDGECSEGAVWEAAQFAAEKGLSNLVAIVDVNGLQQSGPAPSQGNTAVLAKRFKAFGWQTLEIDGHDVMAVAQALTQAREGGPTAILARTVKGKGVSFLEGKEGYHGKPLSAGERDAALKEIPLTKEHLSIVPRRVAAHHRPPAGEFHPIPVDYPLGEQVATRAAFGQALQALGDVLSDLVVLDGDVKNSTYTELFKKSYPERFYDANIAEQNMIGTALGLGVSGKIPVAATFSAFLSRAYDFIRMASHTRPPHLILCGSHAGISIGQDGPSQMGLEDLAMFRAVEGTTILYPSDAVSAVRLTEQAMHTPGIVYLRTTRAKTPVIYGKDETFPVGGSKTLTCAIHDALTIVACGITVHEALAAHRELLKRGIKTRVIDAYSVNPLDVATLEQAARETGHLLVVEDHNMSGGLGDAVSAQIGRLAQVFRAGITTEPRSGKPEELMEQHHISSRQLVLKALSIVEQGHLAVLQ